MASRAASAEYQPTLLHSSQVLPFMLALLSEKLVGFEMGNVVNEYHYSVRTVFNE